MRTSNGSVLRLVPFEQGCTVSRTPFQAQNDKHWINCARNGVTQDSQHASGDRRSASQCRGFRNLLNGFTELKESFRQDFRRMDFRN